MIFSMEERDCGYYYVMFVSVYKLCMLHFWHIGLLGWTSICCLIPSTLFSIKTETNHNLEYVQDSFGFNFTILDD